MLDNIVSVTKKMPSMLNKSGGAKRSAAFAIAMRRYSERSTMYCARWPLEYTPVMNIARSYTLFCSRIAL